MFTRKHPGWIAAFVTCLAGCGAPPGTGDPAETEQLESPLVGAPAKKTRTIAAMMFDIGGGAPDKTKIQDLLAGPNNSQRHMYQEVSFGMQDLEIGCSAPTNCPKRRVCRSSAAAPKRTNPTAPPSPISSRACPRNTITTSGCTGPSRGARYAALGATKGARRSRPCTRAIRFTRWSGTRKSWGTTSACRTSRS